MKREEIKTYKDACKVIGRKPRTYKDKHLNLYEQLSTITAALNFSPARVGTSLKIKEREDGNYIIENFKELLQDWFWGD